MARVHEIDRFSTPPTITEIESLSREAFATIPTQLRRVLGDVVIQVVDFPDDETLEDFRNTLLPLMRGQADAQSAALLAAMREDAAEWSANAPEETKP